MPKLVVMLRVKNGILFVDEWLKEMNRLVDEIVVVDNGSTDGTLELLKKHPKVVGLKQTEGFHESRDKIAALELARKQHADWILWFDIDEFFEDRIDREMLDKMMQDSRYDQYSFRLFHFHKDYNHFEARLDILWAISTPSRRLWRDYPRAYFQEVRIHTGPIQGIKGRCKVSPVRIKHYGAVDNDYLERKTNVYISVDPDRKDMYLKHKNQNVPVWLWFEYNENPFRVNMQNILLNFFHFIKRLLTYIRVIKQRLKRGF